MKVYLVIESSHDGQYIVPHYFDLTGKGYLSKEEAEMVAAKLTSELVPTDKNWYSYDVEEIEVDEAV